MSEKSEKIDLSAIQYVPPSHETEPPVEDKDVDKMIKKAQTMKKAMDKENKEVDDKQKEKQMMDKQRLIAILQLYLIEFKDRLAQFKKTNFQKMSLAELQDLRKQFDGIISSKSSMKQTQNMILTGVRMLETTATMFTPIQCQGLSNAIQMDPDAIDDIKHISLKHMGMVAVEPEYRLAHKIIGSVMLLHNVNSAMKPANDKLLEVNQKYSDL